MSYKKLGHRLLLALLVVSIGLVFQPAVYASSHEFFVDATWEIDPATDMVTNFVSDSNGPLAEQVKFEVEIDPIPDTGTFYVFVIPNIVDEMPTKNIWVDLTWVGGQTNPWILPILAQDSGGGVTVDPATPVQVGDDGAAHFVLHPNPDWELVKVWAAGDQKITVADFKTNSVPIPPTFGLLAFGIGGLLVLRRKFQKKA